MLGERGGTLLSPTHRTGYMEKLRPVRMRGRDVKHKSIGTSIVHGIIVRPCVLLACKYWNECILPF